MQSTISKRGVSHNAWTPYGAQVSSSDSLPYLLHGCEEGLRVTYTVEFEVDHSKVWIVDGS
jgi:hypothetical protein